MSFSEAAVAGGRSLVASTRARAALRGRALGLAALVALAAVLAAGLSHIPLPAIVAAGGSVATIVLLAITVASYELAIALGFVLFAVVLVEPAPSDFVFAVVMVVAAVTGQFRLSTLPRPAIWAVGGFVVVNFLSLVDVISWSAAARFFASTLYLGLFGLWLAGYVDRPARARRLVGIYLFIAILSAALGTLALFTHFPGSATFVGYGTRAKALFKDPNVYGPFLVPIAVVLAEEMLRPRLLRMRRWSRFAAFLLLTIGVLFSYSRAAWLNYAVALIVLIGIVVLRRLDRRAIALMMVLLVGGLAISGAIVATGSLAFLKDRAQLQNYDSSRFAAQSEGVRLGLDHPFGIGPGQFDVISATSTHSIYVRVLSEQGVLGLGVLTAFILSTLVLGTMNVARGRDTYGISAAALLAAWCGLLANGFFIDTLHWRHLWLVAALIWAGSARSHRRSAAQVPYRPGDGGRVAAVRLN